MTQAAHTHWLVYFGKIPSHGDFVRSSTQSGLPQVLDTWLSGAIQIVSSDPHWKAIYDQMPACHFAVMGSQSPHMMPGFIAPSRDESGRRFPFVAGQIFTAAKSLDKLSAFPRFFEPFWLSLSRQCHALVTQPQGPHAKGTESLRQYHFDLDDDAQERAIQEGAQFLERYTVADLQQAVSYANVRQAILAIGLLLQPVLSLTANDLDKGLDFPLPERQELRGAVASYWLVLVSYFLRGSAYEITTFFPQVFRKPRMLLHFSSNSAQALSALLDERLRGENYVSLSSCAWVEEPLSAEYGLKKLSNYLFQPQLTLQQAALSFEETFRG